MLVNTSDEEFHGMLAVEDHLDQGPDAELSWSLSRYPSSNPREQTLGECSFFLLMLNVDNQEN